MKVYCVIRVTQDREFYTCDVLENIYFLKDKAQRSAETLNKQSIEAYYKVVEKEIIE